MPAKHEPIGRVRLLRRRAHFIAMAERHLNTTNEAGRYWRGHALAAIESIDRTLKEIAMNTPDNQAPWAIVERQFNDGAVKYHVGMPVTQAAFARMRNGRALLSAQPPFLRLLHSLPLPETPATKVVPTPIVATVVFDDPIQEWVDLLKARMAVLGGDEEKATNQLINDPKHMQLFQRALHAAATRPGTVEQAGRVVHNGQGSMRRIVPASLLEFRGGHTVQATPE